MPLLDFDPDEPLLFPQPVEQKLTSAAYMAAIRATPVPSGQTALWFLGQNSWVVKTEAGTLLAVDPYLTDFCASKRTGQRGPKSRLLPVFIEPEDFTVDAVLLTHSHADHADPFTLERLACRSSARFLAPWQAAQVARDAGVPESRLTLMHPLQKEIVADVTVTGCFAEPTDFTDLNHMGYALTFAGGTTWYNSGDTALTELLAHVKALKPKVMSVCINGGYHNLSHWEAAEVVAQIGPEVAIPAHYDLFPHNLQPPHMFRKSLFQKAPQVDYKRMAYYEPYFF